MMKISSIQLADQPWIEATLSDQFGSPQIVSRGVLHDGRILPGYVARMGSRRVGLVQYDIHDDECEIVVLVSTVHRRGVGTALLERAEDHARGANCRRLWLVTTNNNQTAREFYASLGWRQSAIHKGAVNKARKLKPGIPEADQNGVPIEDEVEFELILAHE